MEESGNSNERATRDYRSGKRGTPRRSFILTIAVVCAMALVFLLAAFLAFQIYTISSKSESIDENYVALFFAAAGLLLSIFIAAVTVVVLIESIRAVGQGQLDETDGSKRQ